MKRARLPFALASLFLVVGCSKAAHDSVSDHNGKGGEEVIYGDDNRVDFYSVKDASVKVSTESTVALMSAKQIGVEIGGLRALKGSNYGQTLGLCKDEPFYEQNTGAFCSGFLIADDLIVTAGHCVPDLKSCGEASYVFGYRVSVPGVLPATVPASEVYQCAELIHTQSPSDGADFAIVRLDRKVTNHAPLVARPSGGVAVGDKMTLIGYPEGLPLKVADGATVRSAAKPGFFVANSDSYGGNSGSAVINSVTHVVEGVLVRGEKDFEWTPDGCARSYRCKPDACRGEDITRIGDVMAAVPTM